MTEPTKEALKAAIDLLAECVKVLEDPPEAVIARGVQMLNTPRSGSDETLVHDIWQAMLDELRAFTEPTKKLSSPENSC